MISPAASPAVELPDGALPSLRPWQAATASAARTSAPARQWVDRIRPSAIPQACGAVNFARPRVVPLTVPGARRRPRARGCMARRLLAEPAAVGVLLHPILREGDRVEMLPP